MIIEDNTDFKPVDGYCLAMIHATIDQGLEHQNDNPLKVLTSGKERRIKPPFYAGGKWRVVDRVQWWKSYGADQPLCIFGHYSN